MIIETPAQANGVFADVLSKKADRKRLNAQVNNKNHDLLNFIEKYGPVLVYDANDQPKILHIKTTERKELNKQALASDLGLAIKQMTLTKIAKMVKAGDLTAEKIADYEEDEVKQSLALRKPKKEELERFRNMRPVKAQAETE